jgi:hypothetical protein
VLAALVLLTREAAPTSPNPPEGSGDDDPTTTAG